MAGTFSQIYIQVVFAVKGRESLISPLWEEELYKYITGIVKNKEQKMLAINGMPDHIHFLIGMKPSCCLSDLVREIKKSSNEFIKEKKFTKFKFQWQEALIYYPIKVEKFMKTFNRQPNIKSTDFNERRMAEAILFLKDLKRRKQIAINN